MTLLVASLALVALAVVLLGVFRDLLYGALGLALASALLSIVLFQFGANVAAVFELSVCAGLITVLFVSTVSLTKDSDQKSEARWPALLLAPAVALIGAGAWFGAHWLGAALPAAGVPVADSFQDVFWGQRPADLLGQVALVLTGVFGLHAVLRVRAAGRRHD